MMLLVASWACVSCGLKGGTPNSGNCTGTYVNTGTLQGLSGSSASGSVNTYDQGNGSYCINLTSISYSGNCMNSMQVMALANGQYVSAGTIAIFGGTQNFYYNGSAPNAVYFHCPGNAPPANMYAVANLI